MRFALLVAMLSLALLTSDAHAQWHTKQYHARQVAGTNTAQATINIKNISPNDPDWKASLINAQYQIRKAQFEAERQREENDAYLEALATLGVPSYGQGYSGASVAQSAAYGGNSIYGYSYSQFADYFNAGDRQVTLNQYQNAANRTLDLASQATADMKEVLSLDIAGHERVATILAEGVKGEAIIRAAADVAGQTKNSIARVQTTVQGPGPGPIPPPLPQPSEIRIASTASCAKCHTGAKPPGGIILDGSSPLSIDHYTASVVAVDRGTMPPPDSGTALTQPEQEATIAGLKQLLGN